MTIDKRISYRFGKRGYQGSSPSRSYGPPGSKSRQSAPTHQPSNQPSRGPSGPPSVLNPPTKKKTTVTTGGPPSVLNPPTKKKTTVTTGGPPSVLNPPPKKKTTTWTPGAGKPTHIPKKKNLYQKYMDHKNFIRSMHVRALQDTKFKNYHQLGGYDFMSRYNINPTIAKGLGYGYQGIFEGLRSLNPFDDYTFTDAMKRAKHEGDLNALGIEAFSDPDSQIAQEYKAHQNWSPLVTLSNGGIVNLFKYGGFLG